MVSVLPEGPTVLLGAVEVAGVSKVLLELLERSRLRVLFKVSADVVASKSPWSSVLDDVSPINAGLTVLDLSSKNWVFSSTGT